MKTLAQSGRPALETLIPHSLYICTRTWALSWHSQLLIRVREKEEEDKKTKEKGYEDIRTANRTTPHRSASR